MNFCTKYISDDDVIRKYILNILLAVSMA